MKEKLLVSACLLGRNCKYNGGNNYTPPVGTLKERYELVPVCPGGFRGPPLPHPPPERGGGKGLSQTGEDGTAGFRLGGGETMGGARRHGTALALLKERSPSCGFGAVYDGTFTGTVVPGNGVAAELLAESGVAVYGESRIQELLDRA